MIPILLEEYIKYCNIREKANNTSVIDLSSYNWFYPSSLLPLVFFMKNNESMDYVPPPGDVGNYIDIIMTKSYSQHSTYVPITHLPPKKKQANEVITNILKLHNNGSGYGGRTAFSYLINELIDNIYQHSKFMCGCVMAQKYNHKGFVEIAIYDNGISIPTCFKNNNIVFAGDCDAIFRAINGLSTKGEGRGFGLSSSTNLYVNGMGGELLLISRNGALYKKGTKEQLYNLQDIYGLNGTLINLRVPYPVQEVENIYEYIGG